MKKFIAGGFYLISIFSAIMVAGVPNVANWWDLSIPYYLAFFISLIIGTCLTFTNQIRRVTYPILVCMSAWAYKHKIVMTKFTRNTYRVYQATHSSYGKLFDYTQALFDIYLEGIKS